MRAYLLCQRVNKIWKSLQNKFCPSALFFESRSGLLSGMGRGEGEHVRRQAICCWMCPSCVTLRMALQLYSTFYIRETKHQLNYKRKVIELHSGTFNESHPKYRAWTQKPKQLNWSTLSPSPFTSRVTVNCVSQVPWKGNGSMYTVTSMILYRGIYKV